MTDQAVALRSYIEYVPLDELMGWERNPKDHDLPSIQKSIKRFGFTSPVLVDERTKRIVAGHGRVDSLRALQSSGEAPPLRVVISDDGRWLVPVLRGISFNSDSEVEAYLVADNQLTIAGGWDESKLGAILQDLEKLGDGAFEGLGFEQAEIDAILTNLANQSGGGDTSREVARRTLAEMFIVPPFSVLDARQGYWQDRKRAWIALGIRSEIGRGQNLLKFSKTAQIGVGGVKPTGRNRLTPGGGSRSEKTAWTNYGKAGNGRGLAEAYSSGAPGSLGKLYADGNKTKLADYQADNPTETGTSIFDPVLCEILYKWFCPQGGMVLDPFSGGSVRGIVSGYLGNPYTGIDLSSDQVQANLNQAAEINLDIKAYQAQAPQAADQPTSLPQNLELARKEGRPVLLPDILSSGQGATDALELYAATSSLPFQREWSCPDVLTPYLQLVYKAADQPLVIDNQGQAAPYKALVDNGSCWVQFTGGKDSTAAAIRAEQLGYKIICYHLQGLNRGMSREADNCRLICKRMGWTLIIDKVHAVGKKSGLVELPTKDQVSEIAMLARMAEQGGAIWTSGNYITDLVTRWDYDFSDSEQAHTTFGLYLSARYPNQKQLYLVEEELDAWQVCAKAGLINYINGCVCNIRFYEQRRAINERKYGKLLRGRCGSCAKDAWEQLALSSMGIIPPNPALIEHGKPFIMELANERHPTYEQTVAKIVPPATAAKYYQADWVDQPEPPQTLVTGSVDQPLQSAPLYNFAAPQWLVGDSLSLTEILPANYQADFVFSCPPYHDLEQYSDDPKDLSNMSWADFCSAYKGIINQAISRLKDDRFACFVVGEIRNQDGGGFYKGLVPLTIEAFEAAGARFYNEMILVTAIGSLPIRVGKQFTGNRKIGKTHQNILVFYKGNPAKIKDLFPSLVPNADLTIFTDTPPEEGE